MKAVNNDMQDQPNTLDRMLSKRNVYAVFAGLLFLLGAGAVAYGPRVLLMAVVAYVFSYAFEFLFMKIRKTPVTYKSIISPLIFVLILPPSLPFWMVAVGSAFGTFFGKSVFGGEGKNIFNPAAVGVLFLTISFPVQMLSGWVDPLTDIIVTGATPLTSLNRTGSTGVAIWDLLLARTPGTIGETFRLGIIVIGVGLALIKAIDWRLPVISLTTVLVINLIGHLALPDVFPEALPSILTGGLMFASVFVLTDPVTAPVKSKSKIWYAIGFSVIVVLIRTFATFQEGVIFAVIIMNALAPLIDGEDVYRLEAGKED